MKNKISDVGTHVVAIGCLGIFLMFGLILFVVAMTGLFVLLRFVLGMF